MREREYLLYLEASKLAVAAMGHETVRFGRRGKKVIAADSDPLAYWCLTEAIVTLAKRYDQRRLAP